MRKIIDKRYKVLQKIGAGATGIIYRVEDLKSTKIIALKILSKQKTSSEAIQRFKREFQLLAQLHHPNLCSVYDFGTLKDGRSYFTMEYINGKDISTAAKGVAYEKIYAWIVQLCRALEYIHTKGLIHYDIKPGNVLIHTVNNNTIVKLTDFGLAGEQRIKGGAMIKGTFPYIAPEVIEGLAVDCRADLYSLGVLLCEIFAPKPFREEKASFVSLLQQRIQRGATLPSKIVGEISNELQHLLLQLLAFEPAARFSRANEVIKEINKFSRSKFEYETQKTIEGYLLSSRFVGRDKEMELLQSLYEQASKGEGRIVLVTGEAGIGKSRLLKEFKIFAQLQRSHNFMGYAYKNRIGLLHPLYDIFKELITYIGDVYPKSLSKNIKISIAVLATVFPDLIPRHLEKSIPKLVPLGAQQEKLRTFEALSTLIEYCAEYLGELIILLEDLHWADDLTIQFLGYLGRNLTGKNIIICATSRKEEIEENVVLKRIITDSRSEGYLVQIELKPLQYKSLASFLDSTITSESNSPELVKYLKKKTGGNPFFVEEMMRSLLRKRRISIGEPIETKYLYKIDLPKTIEDVVLKRVRDLDRTCQKIVKFAAIILGGFTFDIMKRLTDLNDTELSRALWELKKRQILFEENNQFRFCHVMLREALNKPLSKRERCQLNYRVGITVESMNKKSLKHKVEDLAYYFINSKDHNKGVMYGLQAARKSSKRYANEQAIKLYEGVLDLIGNKNNGRRTGVLREIAKIEDLAGYYNNAINHYTEILRHEHGSILKNFKMYHIIGDIYVRKGYYNKALHMYRKATRCMKLTKHRKSKSFSEVYTIAKMCTAYLAMGNYKGASKFNLDNVKLPKMNLKNKKTLEWQSNLYHNLGVIEDLKVEFGKGNYNKAIFYYMKAYRGYKYLNDKYIIAGILNNIGINYFFTFNFQKAIDYYKRAIKLSEKIGYQYAVSAAFANLGQIFKKRGDYSKAIEYLEKSATISKKIGDHSIISITKLDIGDCFLLLCDYDRAKKYYQQMLTEFAARGFKEKKAHPLMGLGNVSYARGKYTSALRFHRKSLRISKDIGHRIGVAHSTLRIAVTLTEIGEFFSAQKYIGNVLETAIALELKDLESDCYLALGNISLMMKNYAVAKDYYKKGIRIAKKYKMKLQILQLVLLVSQIYYHEAKYLEGIKFANRAIKMAKDMGTKDIYVEVLLIKTKNELRIGILSKTEIITIMEEAIRIAEDIGCSEVLWKVYFEYGYILQQHNENLKALQYYQKCIEVLMDVCSEVTNKSHEESYLKRFDRKVVFAAVDVVGKLV